MNLFCRDRAAFHVDDARRQLAIWMRRSHYWAHREWVCRDITPRIVCERLLIDPAWSSPSDSTASVAGRLGIDIFDVRWQKPPFVMTRPDSGRVTKPPSNFDELVDCARRLSRGWPFVRVDLSCSGRVSPRPVRVTETS